jgi:hypothetical protein
LKQRFNSDSKMPIACRDIRSRCVSVGTFYQFF